MTPTAKTVTRDTYTDPYLRLAEQHQERMRQQAEEIRLAQQVRAAGRPTVGTRLAMLLAGIGIRLAAIGTDAPVERGASAGDTRR